MAQHPGHDGDTLRLSRLTSSSGKRHEPGNKANASPGFSFWVMARHLRDGGDDFIARLAMAKVLACVVERPVDAQRLIEELTRECMCDRRDISVLARDQENWVAEAATKAAGGLKGAVGSGAQAIGSLFKALAESAEPVSRVPGGAMLRASGDFGVQLVTTGAGTAAEIANALIDAGVPKAEAGRYGRDLERGGILITVEAKTEKSAQCIRKVMAAHGAVATQAL